jgi:hypothetical protein
MAFKKFFQQYKILTESYADASRIFSASADKDEVGSYIAKFKDLSTRNVLKPEDKDITQWIKKGFGAFKSLVDSYQNTKSKKQEKLDISKDAIKVADNSLWTVIIPLTAQASCKYGANTKWCTAGKLDNRFNAYFHSESNEITLFYIISKIREQKFAVALITRGGEETFSNGGSQIEYDCYDENDNNIDISEITDITQFTSQNFRDWEYKHMGSLEKKREEYKANIHQRYFIFP